jgi:PAS domain S-box-containing protein
VNDQVRLLWLTVDDGLYLLRRSGAFADVNPIGCELLGYDRDELLALNVLDVLDVQDGLDAGDWDAVWTSLAPGEAHSMEAVARRRDGTLVAVHVRMTPVRSGSDAVMLALVRDASARRATGAERSPPAEQQLRAQVDRLRQLETTAAGIAHDLKNLLGIVLNYGAFAVEAASGQPELRADLTEIVQAAERAVVLATSLEAHANELGGAGPTVGEPEPAPAPPSVGETILVVEDEEAIRRVTTRILSERGYEILAAASFEAAASVWETHQATIDLLLTDAILGRRSGADLADVVWQTAPELPVLFISGGTTDVPIRRGSEHRTAIVEKPLGSESLLRSVGAALEGRS